MSDRDAIADLLARGMEMGTTDQYIVMTEDPQSTSLAYGPFEGAIAVTVAGTLRDNFKTDDLGDVVVTLVPWVAWESPTDR